MSALQFLNKKSWHTSTIRNNEKVWLAEQAAAKEQARVAELQKQLEEERKHEEIQRLEIESGRLDPADVLKRRRLNWMYEHASPNVEDDGPDAKRRKMHGEAHNVVLDNAKVDLDDNEKETQAKEKSLLVDTEAKLRADPMMQIEREKAVARQVLGRDEQPTLPKPRIALPAMRKKYTVEELAAKKARKEERRVIREERKRRKEEKAMKKRIRAEQYEAKFFDVDVTPRDDNDAKLFDSPPRKSIDSPREHSPRSERQRSDSPGADSTGLSEGMKYGLHIPNVGTGVAVTKEFVPRNCDDTAALRRSESHRDDRPTQPPLSARRVKSERTSRPPLSPNLRGRAEEKRRLLKEMKEDALRLEDERRVRAQKHVQDANREREAMDERFRRRKSSLSVLDDEPATSFARNTFSKGRTTADRIRQRRAWSTKDSNASY